METVNVRRLEFTEIRHGVHQGRQGCRTYREAWYGQVVFSKGPALASSENPDCDGDIWYGGGEPILLWHGAEQSYFRGV